jgi:hypothetical protein
VGAVQQVRPVLIFSRDDQDQQHMVAAAAKIHQKEIIK